VSGLAGHLALDDLTVTPVPANDPSVGSRTTTYQAENGALTGTAHERPLRDDRSLRE
jgi:hypothetical protein